MTAAPTIQSWKQLWRLWDAATLHMIPDGQHRDRPLQLRQPFVFYLGHLPAFCDARLTKVLQQPLTEPAYYADMFARGIDPDLDDPTQCHSHSPTPPQWPDVADILAYRDRVRARILQTYSSSQLSPDSTLPSSTAVGAGVSTNSTSSSSDRMRGANGASLGLGIDSAAAAQLAVAAAAEEDAETAAIAAMPFELQHVLWMSYEHEAMHLETLMYLLVQYEAVQPPPPALLADSPSVAWHSGIAAAAAAAAAAAVGVDDPSSCRPFCSPGLPGDAAGSTAAQLLPPLPPAAAVVSSPAGQRLLLLPPAASWVQVAPCKVSHGFTPGPTLGSTADVGVVQNNINSSSSSSSSSDVQPLQCGWDNESPAREVSVAGFQVQHRPVTVLEYLHFLAAKLADGLAAGSEATVGSDDGISTCMGTADACPASLGGSEKDTHSCRTSRMQCSSSQADTALGGRPSSTCTAGCIEGLQDRCYPGSPAGSSASSSTNLPRVLAAASDSNQQEAGAGCCRVLQDLLGSPAARGLLPASLALHAAGTACRSGHTEASCTATMASSSSPCSPSGRCSGLCRLHTLPAATSQPASTASPATTQGATSQQQLARTTVLRALQQQLGVKTVFGLTPISIAGYWPIYCSALQAEQYAAWLSEPSQHYRLLTEHELLAARQHNATLGSRSGSAEAFAGSSVQTGVLGSVGVTGTAGGVGSGGSSHASPGCAEPAVASGDAEAFAGSSVSLGVLGSAGVSCSSGRVSSSHAGCAGLATLGVEQGFGQKACWGAGPAAEAPAGDEYESGDSTPEQHWSTISGRGGHTSCSSAAAVSMQSLVTANSMPLGTGFAVWHPLCVALLPSGVAGAAPAAAAGNDAPQQANKEQRCSSVNLPSSGLECSSAVEVSQLCENGWEWTSTVFKRHKGFQANPLYPEYSEDFFGGKHVVLLGGSWATVDSIAGRPSFRNFYQKGQQHVFAKFRLCRA